MGVTTVAEELDKYDPNKKYKYEQLKGKDNCPKGVDRSIKEVRRSSHVLLHRVYGRV